MPCGGSSATRRPRSNSTVQHLPLAWPELLPWQVSSPLQPPLFPESPILAANLLAVEVDHHLWVVKLIPCRPSCVAPTISLCFSLDSAPSTAALAVSFLLDFTSVCMFLTTWPLMSLVISKRILPWPPCTPPQQIVPEELTSCGCYELAKIW